MKKNYSVVWYEYNLTNLKCRNFFTKTGASLFAGYLKYCFDTDPQIYEIGD